MKKVVDDTQLMVKVCDLYYNKGVDQKQIAETLGISRPTVSRLLAAARERGIVRITVMELDSIKHWDLERALRERYGLKEVIVVDDAPTREEREKILGAAAGQYLLDHISGDSVVGVSMGTTLLSALDYLEKQEAPGQWQGDSAVRTGSGPTFVPLIGGMGKLRMELHSNSIAEALSRKLGGEFVPIHAPARVSDSRIRTQMMQEESVAAAIRLEDKMDLALSGIGYPNEGSSISATGYYRENEVESLLQQGAVGEICMQFYDKDGHTEPFREYNKVIGVDVSRLRKIPLSVGVAGGIEKTEAIRGAILGKYINVLITDKSCAQALAN